MAPTGVLPTVYRVQEQPEDLTDPSDVVPPDPARETPTLWLAAATGADPATPDPGCQHVWENLCFLEDDDGLYCVRCERVWLFDGSEDDDSADVKDALLTVWQSTRQAFRQYQSRIDALTSVLQSVIGMVSCAWCDHWEDDPSRMVTLKHRRACPEHVGALLGSIAPVDATELGFARVWLSAGLTVSPDDLYHAWLTEKTVVDCPELDIETFDGEILGERRLSIDALWASRLGVSLNPSMTDVTGALAEKLELPPPASRPGRMMLLGFLARALHVLPPGATLAAREVESALLEALPVNGRDLATVVLDLFRHELPQDGVVNGDLAEVLVQALLSRAAETLFELSSQPG